MLVVTMYLFSYQSIQNTIAVRDRLFQKGVVLFEKKVNNRFQLAYLGTKFAHSGTKYGCVLYTSTELHLLKRKIELVPILFFNPLEAEIREIFISTSEYEALKTNHLHYSNLRVRY